MGGRGGLGTVDLTVVVQQNIKDENHALDKVYVDHCVLREAVVSAMGNMMKIAMPSSPAVARKGFGM